MRGRQSGWAAPDVRGSEKKKKNTGTSHSATIKKQHQTRDGDAHHFRMPPLRRKEERRETSSRQEKAVVRFSTFE